MDSVDSGPLNSNEAAAEVARKWMGLVGALKK